MKLRIVVLPEDVEAAETTARAGQITNARLCPVGRAFARAFSEYREPKWWCVGGAYLVIGRESEVVVSLPDGLMDVVRCFDKGVSPLPHLNDLFIVDVPDEAFA